MCVAKMIHPARENLKFIVGLWLQALTTLVPIFAAAACVSKSKTICRVIPTAIKSPLCARRYKGCDCPTQEEQGVATKAAPGATEGPVGGVTRRFSAVRCKTAQKMPIFRVKALNL